MRQDLKAHCPYASRAHRGAWRKGYEAWYRGVERERNPYKGAQFGGRRMNIVNGRRGFEVAWNAGWDFASSKENDDCNPTAAK